MELFSHFHPGCLTPPHHKLFWRIVYYINNIYIPHIEDSEFFFIFTKLLLNYYIKLILLPITSSFIGV